MLLAGQFKLLSQLWSTLWGKHEKVLTYELVVQAVISLPSGYSLGQNIYRINVRRYSQETNNFEMHTQKPHWKGVRFR